MMAKMEQQQKRLKQVTRQEWEEALDELLPEITRLLHGKLVVTADGKKVMIGGHTRFGAHTSYRLGGYALYHYESLIVSKLYDGSCEWKAENTLAVQLKKIANSVIPKESEKYRKKKDREKKHGYNSTPVSMDVEWLSRDDKDLDEDTEFRIREDDGEELGMDDTLPASDEMEVETIGLSDTIEVTSDNVLRKSDTAMLLSMKSGEIGSQHQQWEMVCQAADDSKDKLLQAYVQATGECQTEKDVRDLLGLKSGESGKLKKKLKNIINERITKWQKKEEKTGKKSKN